MLATRLFATIQRNAQALLLYLVAILTAVAPAIAADDKFEIRAANISSTEGVYLLNAKMHFALPDGARQAVRDGVALTLAIEIHVERSRRWWLDETVATLEQRYEVVYHALSQNYLLRNINSGEQVAYSSLDAAVEALSNLRDLPILDQSLLEKQQDYEVRMRAALDVRTLPDTLRLVLFWTDDWRQKTEWYIWPIKQ